LVGMLARRSAPAEPQPMSSPSTSCPTSDICARSPGRWRLRFRSSTVTPTSSRGPEHGLGAGRDRGGPASRRCPRRSPARPERRAGDRRGGQLLVLRRPQALRGGQAGRLHQDVALTRLQRSGVGGTAGSGPGPGDGGVGPGSGVGAGGTGRSGAGPGGTGSGGPGIGPGSGGRGSSGGNGGNGGVVVMAGPFPAERWTNAAEHRAPGEVGLPSSP
jgi:hypothetical protein